MEAVISKPRAAQLAFRLRVLRVTRARHVYQRGSRWAMADDLTKRRPQDPKKINLSEDWEMKYWCDKLKVSPEELKAAVSARGSSVAAVEKRLAGKRGR